MSCGRSLLEDLLARGVDDWIYVAEVFSMTAGRGIADPRERRALALGLITEALVQGFMEAGDIEGGEFKAWDLPVSEAIARVAEAWLARTDPAVMPGEVAWLNNTEQGTQLGEAVLAREGR